MWSTRNEQLAHARGINVRIDWEDRQLTFSEVLRGWRYDPAFRTFFIALLADAPFFAFRWETPPITTASVGQPFEYVLLDSPELAVESDPQAFAEHFGEPSATQEVVAFPNLRNDAILVVPCPKGPLSAYGHLGAFVRQAPEAQVNALWSLVGGLMEEHLGPNSIWLSTAGAGVPWLHLRLDQKPKYYRHAPYRDMRQKH